MTKDEGMDNIAEPSLMGGAVVRLKRKGWTTPHKEEAPAHVRKIGDIFWGRLTARGSRLQQHHQRQVARRCRAQQSHRRTPP